MVLTWLIGELAETFRAFGGKLTPRSRALLKKPPVVQLLKKVIAFYGTRMFFTAFTRALHWFLSLAISNQSNHPILSLQDLS
jgi:hypothetical protein